MGKSRGLVSHSCSLSLVDWTHSAVRVLLKLECLDFFLPLFPFCFFGLTGGVI